MILFAITLSIAGSIEVTAPDSLAYRLAASLSEQQWFDTSSYEVTVLDSITIRCSNCPNGFKAESIILNGPDTLGRVYRWHVLNSLRYAIELGNEFKVFTDQSECIISAKIYGHRSDGPPTSMFDLNLQSIEFWNSVKSGESVNYGNIEGGNGYLHLPHDNRNDNLELTSVSVKSGNWEGESVSNVRLSSDDTWYKLISRFYSYDTLVPVKIGYGYSFPKCSISIFCDSRQYCLNRRGKISEVFIFKSNNEQGDSVTSHSYGWVRRLFNKRLDHLPLLELIGVTCPEYYEIIKDHWITPPFPD